MTIFGSKGALVIWKTCKPKRVTSPTVARPPVTETTYSVSTKAITVHAKTWETHADRPYRAQRTNCYSIQMIQSTHRTVVTQHKESGFWATVSLDEDR